MANIHTHTLTYLLLFISNGQRPQNLSCFYYWLSFIFRSLTPLSHHLLNLAPPPTHNETENTHTSHLQDLPVILCYIWRLPSPATPTHTHTGRYNLYFSRSGSRAVRFSNHTSTKTRTLTHLQDLAVPLFCSLLMQSPTIPTHTNWRIYSFFTLRSTVCPFCERTTKIHTQITLTYNQSSYTAFYCDLFFGVSHPLPNLDTPRNETYAQIGISETHQAPRLHLVILFLNKPFCSYNFCRLLCTHCSLTVEVIPLINY